MNAIPLLLCAALLGWTARAAPFVEVTASIEIVNWHYQEETGLPLKNTKQHVLRCVVGKELWQIENLTRTNVTESTWLVQGMLVRQVSYKSAYDSEPDDTSLRSYRRNVRPASMLPTPDGYPGSELLVNLPWFVFCSGPYLQQSTRGVPLPTAAPGRTVFGFTNVTAFFADGFGLPRTAVFYETPRQIKGRYDVSQSTNVLGWNFPLAFTAEEREPDRFGKWNRTLTVNGRVTSVRAVPKLEVPEDILERIENPDATTTRRR